MKEGSGTWGPRLLAGAALVAAGIALVAVVAGSLGTDEGKRGRRDGPAASGCSPEAGEAVKAGYYIVEEDDLLSLIAERTCVPDEDLLRLNPELDPQTLTPGQCVSLRERGCEAREEG